MDYSVLKKRYYGIDLLRVISVFVVCMFHTTIHLGCDYGFLQGLSKMGAVFMTAFFMISGFSLFVNWGGWQLTDIREIKWFYVKRIFGIVPIYWVVGFIYVAIDLSIGNESVLRMVVLSPIELLGIQTVYSSLFHVSHNGGTWFISCILFCYFLYPFLQLLIKQFTAKMRILVLCFCCVLLLYSPFVVYLFKLESIYSNPFFRILEFLIGMLLAAMLLDYRDSKIMGYLNRWSTVSFTFILMIIAISFALKLNIAPGNYMLYSWICLPSFIVIILGLAGVETNFLKKSKILIWLVNVSLVFFLAQLYSNTVICKRIIEYYNIDNNYLKIILGWIVCFTIAIVLRKIEVCLKRFNEQHILRYFCNPNNINH